MTSLNAEVLPDAVSFVIDFHRDASVSNFIEVRRMLEPQETAIVARTATAEQVAELRAILQRGSLSLPTEMFADIDPEFHQTLNSYCGNPIVDAIENHQPEVAAARAMVHVVSVEDWLKGFRPHLNGREPGPGAAAAGG